MEAAFWLEKWSQGQIGFHQARVHPDLERFVGSFLGEGPWRVLVPLCGKSWDLDWLASRGHEVTGIELSQAACDQFHAEHGRVPVVEEVDGLRMHRSEHLNFVVGDVFALTGTFDRVWDRAAMVALPPALRDPYVARLHERGAGGELLLSTFTYDPTVSSGPPFSIDEQEVLRAYPGAEQLSEVDALPGMPGFRERGHRWLLQRTWRAPL